MQNIATDKSITLITGTRKGTGKFLAQYFLKKNHVVIGCSRKPAAWSAPDYYHYEADVSKEEDVASLFEDLTARFTKLDNLINNAGIGSLNHVLTTPLETVHNIFGTNFVGTFLFCREAGRLMKQKKYGRIVNVTTVALPLKLEGEAIYAASKAAVTSLTETLSKELASFGITVNSIGPAPMETDLIKGVPQDKIARLLQRQAIQRMADFEDVANVIDFYLRPESGLVTGQHIYLCGV